MNQGPDETLGAPAQNTQNPQNVAPQGAGDAAQGGQEMLGATEPQQGGQSSSLQKDPDEWATGDEPMTEAQKSYLDTLAKEAGETLPATLTKAEASKHIDRLQGANDRVSDGGANGGQTA